MTNELDEPCASCGMEEHCDGWEAAHCCTLCTWGMDSFVDLAGYAACAGEIVGKGGK